jgi:hypothetical protein
LFNAVMMLCFSAVVKGWTLVSLARTLVMGLQADPVVFFAQISQSSQAALGRAMPSSPSGWHHRPGRPGDVPAMLFWQSLRHLPLVFRALVSP